MVSANDKFRAILVREDLRAVLLAQLPRDLQTRLTVTIETDAYHLGGKAKFRNPKTGQEWEATLGVADIEGIPVACVVPDWVINHLCIAA